MSEGITQDDPIYRAIMIDLLQPYVQAAREWWRDVQYKTFVGTSTYPVKGAPPGFYEKCTRSPKQSPIYGIQAFPLVATSYLKFPPNITGGAIRMAEHICKQGLEVEEFTIISKLGLNSSRMNGVCLCFIPTEMLGKKSFARWVYMRPNEILELANGIVTNTLAERVLPFAKEYKGDIQ